MTDNDSCPTVLSGAISGGCKHNGLVYFVLDCAQFNGCKPTSEGKRMLGSE